MSMHPVSSAGRRRFLQTSLAAAAGLTVSNCARRLATSTPETGSPQAGSSPQSDGPLRVYTWANYTDDPLLQAFQQSTGIQVIVDTYDSNETMLAKLQAGGGNAYSVIYPSDYMVAEMITLNLLSPLDKSKVQGFDNLKTQWKNPTYDPNSAHSVATVWGTTGIIYDRQKLGSEITGWADVWGNSAKLRRKLTMINDVREVMGATLKFLGHPLNATQPKQLEQAYQKLVQLKPTIASFMTNGWEDQLASGDLLASMAYSQDALSLMAENSSLAYVVPETGASLWTDTIAIPKSAPNPEAAYAWINFMLQPENSAGLVERLKFSTPNQAAFDRLPKALQTNKELFPPESVLSRCEGITPLPTAATNLYDQYWTRLTST